MGPSPAEEAGAQQARTAAQNQKELSAVAFPAIRRLLTQSFGDVSIDQNGQIGIPNSVQEQFGQARTGINRDFDVAERGAQAYTAQSFKQAGNPYSQGQLDATTYGQINALEQGRTRAMGQLKFQEAQAGLGQFNQLMNLMSGGSASALNLGSGYGNAANAATRFLPQQSQGQGAFGGAMAGASAGSALGPYGALAGLLIGGVAGYAGSG